MLKEILQGASSTELETLKDQTEIDQMLQSSLGKNWLAQDAGVVDPSDPLPTPRKRRPRQTKS
jgi:hypothetical protein